MRACTSSWNLSTSRRAGNEACYCGYEIRTGRDDTANQSSIHAVLSEEHGLRCGGALVRVPGVTFQFLQSRAGNGWTGAEVIRSVPAVLVETSSH